MRLTLAATAVVAILSALAGSAQAQVAATGRRMPMGGQATDTTAPRGTPAMGTVGAAGTPTTSASLTDAQQRESTLKAQRDAQARDKAWDAKMKRTMSSICGGC